MNGLLEIPFPGIYSGTMSPVQDRHPTVCWCSPAGRTPQFGRSHTFEREPMQWTKPEIKEIVLGMEVTGYVNTDEGETVNPRNSNATSDSEEVVGISDARAK
jgi:coenzyme PQQ precursor peptide PqqA